MNPLSRKRLSAAQRKIWTQSDSSEEVESQMSTDDLKINEYLITAATHMKPIVETDDGHTAKNVFSAHFPDIRVKALVEKYGDAVYRLTAIAFRIRNYAAYLTKSRHPLSITMQGVRDDHFSDTFFPVTIFDGGTHLPITDGGLGTNSFFTTRFGPDEGLNLPYHSMESKDEVESWLNDLGNRLRFTSKMLELVPGGSNCDVAINCIGESFWGDEIANRLTDCWRAIEAVARQDEGKSDVKWDQIKKSIHKRAESRPDDDRLRFLRELRNISSHSFPKAEEF